MFLKETCTILALGLSASCALFGCEEDQKRSEQDSPSGLEALAGSTLNAGDSERAGEELSGEVAGESASGESVSGESMSGESMSGESMSGESMSGEHASGESASGETSEPNCLVSCAEFTECTIKTCPGYDEPDQNLLMEECLSLCTPGLALIFDTIQGCAEKIRFANSVRGDFLEFCESSSDGFCETYVATCGSWLGTSPCEDHYNLSPAAGASFTEGAHRSCYEYHLGSAMRGLEVNNPDQVQRGCENAAGLSVCIDE